MLQLNEETRKKLLIELRKKKYDGKFKLKINNNKDIFKNNILENNFHIYKMNSNIIEKNVNTKNNKDKSRSNTYNFHNTINYFFSKYKKKNNFNELIKSNKIKLKINNTSHQEKNINLLDFCLFQNLNLENNNKSNINTNKNNLKEKISYSFSFNNLNNINKINKQKKNTIRNKIFNDLTANIKTSEINYSPKFFETYIPKSPQNKKTEDFKHKIILSLKKEKKRKHNIIKNRIFSSFGNLNINETNKKNKIIKDKNDINLSPFSKLLKRHKNLKKVIPLSEKRERKYQNKETSISINCPTNTDIKNKNSIIGNNIIENLFTDKKKMFRSQEIIILNNLNLIYSENDKQFENNYLKHSNKKSLFGLCLTHLNSSPILIKKNLDSKIDIVKDKLSLIKSIVDYTYPEIIIRRSMKQSNNYIKKFKRNIRPCNLEILKHKKKEQYLNDYYSSLLKIFH